jgi:hypothetical protein
MPAVITSNFLNVGMDFSLYCLSSSVFLNILSFYIHHSVNFVCIWQVSQNRLTWPGLLDHPFVRETNEEMAASVSFG